MQWLYKLSLKCFETIRRYTFCFIFTRFDWRSWSRIFQSCFTVGLHGEHRAVGFQDTSSAMTFRTTCNHKQKPPTHVHREIQLGLLGCIRRYWVQASARPLSWSSLAVRCRKRPHRTRYGRVAVDISHPSSSGHIQRSESRPCMRRLSRFCHPTTKRLVNAQHLNANIIMHDSWKILTGYIRPWRPPTRHFVHKTSISCPITSVTICRAIYQLCFQLPQEGNKQQPREYWIHTELVHKRNHF